jgi:uncharacterized cupredoxin-like copper-binding protein
VKPRTALPWAAALIAAAPLATAGCGNTTSAESPPLSKGPVRVGLSEFKVTPDERQVKAGRVTFDVRNAGKEGHELVLLRTDKPAGTLGHGKRVPETGKAGEAGDVPAGKSKKVSIKLAPGHYALICNLPGHYAAGMRRDLTVR